MTKISHWKVGNSPRGLESHVLLQTYTSWGGLSPPSGLNDLMRRPENAYHFLQLQPISCNCLLLSSRNFSSLLGVFCLPLGRTNCSVLNKILRFNSLSGQWPLTAFREAGNGTGRCIFRLRSQGFIVPCSAIKLLPFLKYAKKRWHSFASRNNHHHKGCFFLQWVCALTSMKQERNRISHNC